MALFCTATILWPQVIIVIDDEATNRWLDIGIWKRFEVMVVQSVIHFWFR